MNFSHQKNFLFPSAWAVAIIMFLASPLLSEGTQIERSVAFWLRPGETATGLKLMRFNRADCVLTGVTLSLNARCNATLKILTTAKPASIVTWSWGTLGPRPANLAVHPLTNGLPAPPPLNVFSGVNTPVNVAIGARFSAAATNASFISISDPDLLKSFQGTGNLEYEVDFGGVYQNTIVTKSAGYEGILVDPQVDGELTITYSYDSLGGDATESLTAIWLTPGVVQIEWPIKAGNDPSLYRLERLESDGKWIPIPPPDTLVQSSDVVTLRRIDSSNPQKASGKYRLLLLNSNGSLNGVTTTEVSPHLSVVVNPDEWLIQCQGIQGQQLLLEQSSNPSGSFWTPLGDVVIGSNGLGIVRPTIEGTNPVQFYRASSR
jgi:hypothetical protein